MLKNCKGQLYIITSAILFGTMPFLTKMAYKSGSNAYSVVFWRFLFASLFMAIILKGFYGRNLLIGKEKLIQIFGLSVLYAVTPILLYISYNYIDSGLATSLHFTYPISVMILMAILFRTKMEKKKIFCAILCIIGIVMLYSPEKHAGMRGMVLAVISGIVYSLYVILFEKFRLKDESVMVLSFWLCLFASIEVGIFSILVGKLRLIGNISEFSADICLAFFTTVIALVLFQKGAFLCGAVMASLLSTFEPLTGVVIGLIIFNEEMTWKLGMGIFLILFSTVMIVLPVKEKRKNKN